jgi:prevent-host-death family protein
MKESLTITTAKARLSELVNRLIHRGDTIFITRKGKNVAVLLPDAAYRDLAKKEKPGLLSAKGALADLDAEIDDLCALIYQEREKSKDREVAL